jgi:FkbM family methyltransferase
VNSVLGTVGLELHRKRRGSSPNGNPRDEAGRTQRMSFGGVLEHASRMGLTPRSVIDVGAAYGTPELTDVFPDARHILVEPLEEYRLYLEAAVARIPRGEYVIAAATSRSGPVTVHIHADLVGSSMFLETEQSPGLNETPRSVPGITLDDLCADRGVEPPYLIKVDVQGAELDVLSGATRVLQQTTFAILETSLFRFYRDGVELLDVMTFMQKHGFAVYDLAGHLYRPLDDALAQVDVAFVKEDGFFRVDHSYATQAQRAAQTRELLAAAPGIG